MLSCPIYIVRRCVAGEITVIPYVAGLGTPFRAHLGILGHSQYRTEQLYG